MSEYQPTDNDKILLRYIAKRVYETGRCGWSEIRDAFKEIPGHAIGRTISKLLMEGILNEPQEGYLYTDWKEFVDKPSEMWFDIEKLPWKTMIPKSAASKKKGPYENTPEDRKNGTYKEIVRLIMTPDSSGILK